MNQQQLEQELQEALEQWLKETEPLDLHCQKCGSLLGSINLYRALITMKRRISVPPCACGATSESANIIKYQAKVIDLQEKENSLLQDLLDECRYSRDVETTMEKELQGEIAQMKEKLE